MRPHGSPWRASSSVTPSSAFPIPEIWLKRAIDWLENEDLDWEEATARRLRRQKEIKLLRRARLTTAADHDSRDLKRRASDG